jgi:hypothetical protein
MPAFLMIQNPGVADPTAFTLLGASTSRNSGSNQTIGKFGSGNKHGVAVCLRNALPPVVFAGNLRLTFGTTPIGVNNGITTTEFARVQVKYGGKDREGVSRSSTEDLGFVLEYGAADWGTTDLALREFVSNAIDRAIAEGEYEFLFRYIEGKGAAFGELAKVEGSDEREEMGVALEEYRKTARDFKNVKVEVVNENQVRAKDGVTRVFIPMNEDVLRFYNNLGKWFLHFSEPELLNVTILPKGNRNLTQRQAAVIYRRGVRVREFESSDVASLFDYNLPDLEMDESRKVDDWKVRYAAGIALQDASKEELATLFQSFTGTTKFWEWGFDSYGLEYTRYGEKSEATAARQTRWQEAFTAVQGADAVISTPDGGEFAERKGYKVLKAPEAYVKAAGKMGVRTPDKVLTQDDKDGREIVEATPDAESAVDFVWSVVTAHGMTANKSRPKVKCFRKIMSGGSQTLGFYRDGVVYFNTDIAGYGSVEGGQHVLSQQLLTTALEEVAHYVTGAADNSRDFQDYVLNLAVKLAKGAAGIL